MMRRSDWRERTAFGLILLALPGMVSAQTTQGNCGWLSSIAQSTVKNTTATANTVISNGIPPESGSAMRQCLSQISNLGAAFNFGIPTNLFSSLLTQACGIGANQVSNMENQYINQNISYPGMGGVNVGAGQSGMHYTINNNSESTASTIWNKALGPGY